MDNYEAVLRRSPGLRRKLAEGRGESDVARGAALDEFLVLIAQTFDMDKADALAEQYKFTRDEITEQARYAAQVMRQAHMGDLADQVDAHYDLR